jgi:hypothetical protein
LSVKGPIESFAALVLTYDRYHVFAEHMIRSYRRLWPDHPFIFRIPYQDWPAALAARLGDTATFIQAPSPIKQTALALLEGIAEDEWVYWCIDDKYLVELDAAKAAQVAKWVREISDPSICGVSFARARRMLKPEYLYLDQTIGDDTGGTYIRRTDYSQIWLHQFLRGKVLRTLFNGFPDERYSAKEMDIMKGEMRLPEDHRLYVSTANHVIFGESTTRGKVTANCALSLQDYGLESPAGMPRSEEHVVIGKL